MSAGATQSASRHLSIHPRVFAAVHESLGLPPLPKRDDDNGRGLESLLGARAAASNDGGVTGSRGTCARHVGRARWSRTSSLHPLCPRRRRSGSTAAHMSFLNMSRYINGHLIHVESLPDLFAEHLRSLAAL